jgi:hypothetical protein
LQFWFGQYSEVQTTATAVWASAYNVQSVPTVFTTGQAKTFNVTVTNTGNQVWSALGTTAVHLGAHFVATAGGTAVPWLTDIRVVLPADLAPGASVTLPVTVTPPSGASQYVLEFQMVKETLFWFNQFADVGVGIAPVQVGTGTAGNVTLKMWGPFLTPPDASNCSGVPALTSTFAVTGSGPKNAPAINISAFATGYYVFASSWVDSTGGGPVSVTHRCATTGDSPIGTIMQIVPSYPTT